MIDEFYNEHPYPHKISNCRYDLKKTFSIDPFVQYNNVNKNILIAACGTVQATYVANTNPQSTVVGIDVSNSAIKIAKSIKRKLKLKNLSLYNLDIRNGFYSDDTFDIVVASGCIHHIKEPESFIVNSVKYLKGKFMGFVYSDKRPDNLNDISTELRILNITKLSEIRDYLENNHSDVYKWFLNSGYGEPDLIDTFLNPYQTSYDEKKLEKLLMSCGLSDISIAYGMDKNKLFFVSKK